MAYQLKEGQGNLFRVEEKSKESSPDYEGKVLIDGMNYRLAGWLKTSASGKKWLSLKAEIPRPKAEIPRPKAELGANVSRINTDDDIEF